MADWRYIVDDAARVAMQLGRLGASVREHARAQVRLLLRDAVRDLPLVEREELEAVQDLVRPKKQSKADNGSPRGGSPRSGSPRGSSPRSD